MKQLILPEGYDPLLDLKQTEMAIKEVKDFFQLSLSTELRLRRVTAPLFVEEGTGINDDLNGTEKPVSFEIKNLKNQKAEIVQSLAKWKRMMLAEYKINLGYGIYTDMNAIRPDDILDNLHSLYVDQWDWERSISKEERRLEFLKGIVKRIYEVMRRTEFYVYELYPQITPILPKKIVFVHTEELLQQYPDLSPREREDRITEKHKAVFLMGIGHKLTNGQPHDGRAPDYDDWISPTENGNRGLNGDILVWNSVLNRSFEISSMGIRVSPETLLEQLKVSNNMERKGLKFHRKLLNHELPHSIGGGIGQSRLCMFFLRKAHIGEVQASIWPEEMRKTCAENRIVIL